MAGPDHAALGLRAIENNTVYFVYFHLPISIIEQAHPVLRQAGILKNAHMHIPAQSHARAGKRRVAIASHGPRHLATKNGEISNKNRWLMPIASYLSIAPLCSGWSAACGCSK